MRVISVTALLGVAIVAHAGCELPPCPAGYAQYDNRDGQFAPNSDYAYYCIKMPEPWTPPPEPPNLGGFKPPDPPGPRDREAVLRAAIFIESCQPIFMDNIVPSINAHIDATYSAIPIDAFERAALERVNCFKDKTNGCDAVRECLGMTTTLPYPDSTRPSGCADGVGLVKHESYNDWTNCAGLGLECFDELGEASCSLPWTTCDVKTDASHCTDDGRPQNCGAPYAGGPGFSTTDVRCANYGLGCTADATSADCKGPGPACQGAYCTGLGPACNETFADYSAQFLADFRAGIACENSTTLRACVNGHEQLIDCTAQGEGFQCFGGLRPKCAYDFQCEQVDPTRVSEVHFLNATCEGTMITLCNSGVWTTIDCTRLGFKTCDPERGVCK